MRKRDSAFTLSKEQREKAVSLIEKYVKENFETDIGSLQAGIFLDFISEKIGPVYYNQAVADSLSLISDKVDDLYLLMKDEA